MEDIKWDCLEEQCREMVLKARKLEAFEDKQNVLRNMQTTLAQTEWTPMAFIEGVPDEEENLVHIETMALEQMDITQPKEDIPGLNPDLDNDGPKEAPQRESWTMADSGNPQLGTPDGDDLIIAYVRGEPVIGNFELEQTPLLKNTLNPG